MNAYFLTNHEFIYPWYTFGSAIVLICALTPKIDLVPAIVSWDKPRATIYVSGAVQIHAEL